MGHLFLELAPRSIDDSRNLLKEVVKQHAKVTEHLPVDNFRLVDDELRSWSEKGYEGLSMWHSHQLDGQLLLSVREFQLLHDVR